MTASSTQVLPNSPEFTVSELSSALKRTVEDAYGHALKPAIHHKSVVYRRPQMPIYAKHNPENMLSEL